MILCMIGSDTQIASQVAYTHPIHKRHVHQRPTPPSSFSMKSQRGPYRGWVGGCLGVAWGPGPRGHSAASFAARQTASHERHGFSYSQRHKFNPNSREQTPANKERWGPHLLSRAKSLSSQMRSSISSLWKSEIFQEKSYKNDTLASALRPSLWSKFYFWDRYEVLSSFTFYFYLFLYLISSSIN